VSEDAVNNVQLVLTKLKTDVLKIACIINYSVELCIKF